MLDPMNTVNFLFSVSGFGFFLNLIIVFIEVIYAIYSVIFLRQVQVLNKTFRTDAAPIFYVFATIQMLLSIGLVLFSITNL